MKHLDSIIEYIDDNKAAMLRDLQELIAIKSIAEGPDSNPPFGAGVNKAFHHVLEQAQADGFVTKNVDDYGGHLELPGEDARVMGILVHLDVVPEGSGWEEDPYGGTIKDGKIYGRGALDDKGPAMAAYYAMKAVKESGASLRDTVRMILGLDEETDWAGMARYLSKVSAPDYGFTPDGDFPAIHGEMGILVFDIVKKLAPVTEKGLELRSLKGGNAANMVADYARAVIRDTTGTGYDAIRQKAKLFQKEHEANISCKGIGKSLEITTAGVSAHGARPEDGVNAISMMMEFLGTLNFASDDVSDFIEFYNTSIGYELNGRALGCGCSDAESGSLILNVGMAHIDGEVASLTVNIRYPVTAEAGQVYDSLMPAVDRYDMGIVKGKHEKPLFIPADDPMIATLMDVYKKHTGDVESKPLVIGGGTYARAVKNAVAFGARFPGEPELEHQKNECLAVDSLVKMAKIYAEAIYRLAGKEEPGEPGCQ